ncbi:MAG: alpha-L-fucosidase [Anaerocolumna sp.]
MDDKLKWFSDARFGMFIHWGIYSVSGRGEWILNRERIPYEEYISLYANNFRAENYNPDEWVKIAKEAGMRYMVLTTKHHDGFCLWNTKTTDFNSLQLGPKRDIVKEYVTAVRKAGLKVGIYYSPADWHHPDYPGSYARDWTHVWEDEEARKRFVEFYTEQIKELVTDYGKIDLFWYDGCLPKPLDGTKVNKMIKEYQPDILISNRNGEPFDFMCCEQAIVPTKDGTPWEACMTLNDNWGYHRGDNNYKSARDVILLLTETAKDGGNLLLNVGPKGDGTIPVESTRILKQVGNWMDANGEAIYGSEKSPFSWGTSSTLTVKGSKVYIHVHKKLHEICIAEIKNKVKQVYILKSKEKLKFTQDKDKRLNIYGIPDNWEEDIIITLVCEVEGNPEALVERTSFWIPGV